MIKYNKYVLLSSLSVERSENGVEAGPCFRE